MLFDSLMSGIENVQIRFTHNLCFWVNSRMYCQWLSLGTPSIKYACLHIEIINGDKITLCSVFYNLFIFLLIFPNTEQSRSAWHSASMSTRVYPNILNDVCLIGFSTIIASHCGPGLYYTTGVSRRVTGE